MDQDTAKVFELNELIRFYAQVASTEGIRGDIKEKCNDMLEKLFGALSPLLDKQTARAAGIITG